MLCARKGVGRGCWGCLSVGLCQSVYVCASVSMYICVCVCVCVGGCGGVSVFVRAWVRACVRALLIKKEKSVLVKQIHVELDNCVVLKLSRDLTGLDWIVCSLGCICLLHKAHIIPTRR